MIGMRARINRSVGETGRRGTQVTRIPNFRPGTWVKIAEKAPNGLAGKVLQVKNLTCNVKEKAIWNIHFFNGRSVPYQQVERFATDIEITDAQKRRME